MNKSINYYLLLSFLFIASYLRCNIELLNNDENTILRDDGSIITYYLYLPQKENFTLIVVIGGSQCESLFWLYTMSSKYLKDKFGLLVIEKPGITLHKIKRKEYLRKNCPSQRIKDHDNVLSYLKKTLHGWDEKVIWMGGSEGAGLASLLAAEHNNTTVATILFAGGGGIPFIEELKLVSKKQIIPTWTPLFLSNVIKFGINMYFDKKHNTIIQSNTPLKTWLGDTNTYHWWKEALKINMFDALKKVSSPIYIAQGTSDTAIPKESTDLLVQKLEKSGKENITYQVYENLDHSFSDKEENFRKKKVVQEAIKWLETKI